MRYDRSSIAELASCMMPLHPPIVVRHSDTLPLMMKGS